MKNSRILDFDAFLNESDEYRKTSKRYLLDNFSEVPSNTELYNAKEEDFQDLPWYKAIKEVSPEFKLERVRKSRTSEAYSWFFSAPVKTPRGGFRRIYDVYRPSSRYSFSNNSSRIYVNESGITHQSEFIVYLNDKESWNQIFKVIYFSLFTGIGSPDAKSLDHIMNLFSTDLENLYKNGDLGVVGVKKNCNPYGGHYRSTLDFIQNLPYGIYDKIKEEFIKKIKEDPAVIQYAISQCQIPDESSEKAFGDSRLYPRNEVLDFYNHIKKEGYVPPPGFEEETEEISGLQSSLSDIGL